MMNLAGTSVVNLVGTTFCDTVYIEVKVVKVWANPDTDTLYIEIDRPWSSLTPSIQNELNTEAAKLLKSWPGLTADRTYEIRGIQ